MLTREQPIPTRETLDSLPAAVLVVDGDGAIVLCNRRASQILQRDCESLLEAHVGEVLVPLASLREAETATAEDSRRHTELTLGDGTEIYVGFSVAPFEDDSDRDALVVMFQDITPWNRLRKERDRLLQLAAVGEVLPSLLHELKNPLASITTAVEVLVEEAQEDNVQEDLHAILSEIRRLKLSFDGVGLVGRDLHSSSPMAIDFAIREACALLRNKASSASVVLECRVRDMPLLHLDSSVTRAIVFNLVTNALQACKPGCEVAVTASLTDDDSKLELSVSDDGGGMTADVLQNCRTLFFTTKTNGSGIGLALCDRAVVAAGGTLNIESELHRGTCIVARIPVGATTSARQELDP